MSSPNHDIVRILYYLMSLKLRNPKKSFELVILVAVKCHLETPVFQIDKITEGVSKWHLALKSILPDLDWAIGTAVA